MTPTRPLSIALKILSARATQKKTNSENNGQPQSKTTIYTKNPSTKETRFCLGEAGTSKLLKRNGIL